jgi:cytochrome P450/NADPH-cytochrome P450 reductase
MYDEMHDICSQMALKFARQGPDHYIDVTGDCTKLTLDVLALCSMGYRFNSFYTSDQHPFVAAMDDFLKGASARIKRPPLSGFLYREQDRKFQENIETMRQTAKEVLDARREAGDKSDRKDLLWAMLDGVDTRTGKKMNDESLMDNLITFLIAGHETTSATLSFTFYNLLTHPDTFQRAQKEIDEAVGTGAINLEDLNKLPYLNGVLRETLRLSAPIPRYSIHALEDTLLAGKYPVKKEETITLLLAKAQTDPRVFGDDAKEFKPERMMDANFQRIMREFPNAWKPFGNGARGCIGRPFAWQEMLLVVAMLLQNFNFVLEPGYTLKLKEGMTMKPSGMRMRAILRDGLTPTILEKRLAGLSLAQSKPLEVSSSKATSGRPMTILYGSNSGTCEALAQRLASDASAHGFYAAKVDCLDSGKGSLPTGHPVAIITASYEGQPPDNAGHFVSWVESLEKDNEQLKGVDYAVFGCGNKDWVDTFHRIPKLVDTTLEKLGASRLAEMGLSDVSQGEVFTDFESWEDTVFWPAIVSQYDVSIDTEELPGPSMDVKITNPRATTLRQAVQETTVIKSETLTSNDAKSIKKHLEIRLPEDMTYTPGDYLAVLPFNPQETVYRVLRRFGLSRDAHVEIDAAGPAALPINSSTPIIEVLGSYVELSQPATKRVSSCSHFCTRTC